MQAASQAYFVFLQVSQLLLACLLQCRWLLCGLHSIIFAFQDSDAPSGADCNKLQNYCLLLLLPGIHETCLHMAPVIQLPIVTPCCDTGENPPTLTWVGTGTCLGVCSLGASPLILGKVFGDLCLTLRWVVTPGKCLLLGIFLFQDKD